MHQVNLCAVRPFAVATVLIAVPRLAAAQPGVAAGGCPEPRVAAGVVSIANAVQPSHRWPSHRLPNRHRRSPRRRLQAAADQRIAALRAQLRITDAQAQAWNGFAQAMRNNAASTDALFRQRASTAARLSALDNMKSYAQVARAYADNTEALATAFEGLCGVLSDQQKLTVDTLFREGGGGPGPRRSRMKH